MPLPSHQTLLLLQERDVGPFPDMGSTGAGLRPEAGVPGTAPPSCWSPPHGTRPDPEGHGALSRVDHITISYRKSCSTLK